MTRHRLGQAGLAAAVLACAAVPGATMADTPANPLAKLIAEGGGGPFCFERIYDKAHRNRHPRQRTQSVLVSLHAGTDKSGETPSIKMRLRQTGRAAPADIGASCEWGTKANRDTSGNRLIAAYPRDEGFACIALYSNQAAVEAGYLMLDLAADGRSVMVYLDDSIGLWGTLPERTAPDDKGIRKPVPGDPPLSLGPDDRVFRLTRVEPAAACGDMERAIDLATD
ncbi:MAG TPA: hypothetical protein VFZ16_00335 [Hyphomicrobiaceae bacterium]|jgi:hypothetical protein|nr:hypothetical protein [Hyphomicrobiaceae bacterium]